MTTAIDTPPFKSTESALIFAYRFSAQAYPQTSTSKLSQETAHRSFPDGLCSFDCAAQAGMILNEVSRLSPKDQQMLRLRFGKIIELCPCCGVERPCVEWREAFNMLAASFREIENPVLRQYVTSRIVKHKPIIQAEAVKRGGRMSGAFKARITKLRRSFIAEQDNALAVAKSKFKALGITMD